LSRRGVAGVLDNECVRSPTVREGDYGTKPLLTRGLLTLLRRSLAATACYRAPESWQPAPLLAECSQLSTVYL